MSNFKLINVFEKKKTKILRRFFVRTAPRFGQSHFWRLGKHYFMEYLLIFFTSTPRVHHTAISGGNRAADLRMYQCRTGSIYMKQLTGDRYKGERPSPFLSIAESGGPARWRNNDRFPNKLTLLCSCRRPCRMNILLLCWSVHQTPSEPQFTGLGHFGIAVSARDTSAGSGRFGVRKFQRGFFF